MAFRLRSPSLLISLLVVAALACLAVGFQLLAGGAAFGRNLPLLAALLGGVVVFLLGTAAVVTARRFAANGPKPALVPPLELPLVDVRDWSRDLTTLRDDLRREGAAEDRLAEYRERELTVPGSFQPQGRYLLSGTGTPSDPLDDLKRTRDQLLDAAERVDAIVQSIHHASVPAAVRPAANPFARLRRWRSRRD